MSQRPRRTVELLESSSKPSRISRLRQPSTSLAKRSLDRASSCEQLNSTRNYLSVTSIGGEHKRSISATPQRTPNRPIQIPSHILTTEKERAPAYDKKLLQNEANRITDYLRKIESSLGSTFFERGGLKSMSTKQFVTIVNFFFKQIAGNRFTIGNNHVDAIANFLVEIDYPYTINKSWLKTPNAPHAFHNVVTLFSWLIQFGGDTSDIDELENKNVLCGDRFPNKDFVLNKLRRTKEMFTLWNNGTEGDCLDKIKEELCNEYILKRIGLKDLDELKEAINNINFKIDKLLSKKRESNDMKEYDKMQQKIKSKLIVVGKLETACSKKEIEVKNLRTLSEEKIKEVIEVESEFSEIQQIIKDQKCNISQRNDLIEEVNQLNLEKHSIQTFVSGVQELNYKDQVLVSRLIFQQSECITALNLLIYKILKDVSGLENVNENEYFLNKESSLEDLEKIIIFLKGLAHKNTNSMEYYTKELRDLEKQLSLIQFEKETILKPDLENRKIAFHKTEEELKFMEMELMKFQSEMSKKQDDLAVKLANQLSENEKMKMDLVILENEVAKKMEENEANWLIFKTKSEEIIKFKEKRLEILEPAISQLNDVLDEALLSLKDIL